MTAIFYAVETENIELVKLLLTIPDIDINKITVFLLLLL